MIFFKKRNLFHIVFVLLLLSSLLFGTACGKTVNNQKPITFANADWDSIRFHNHIAEIIIESGYGYETDEIVGSSQAAFMGVRNGDIDVFMENWSHNRKDIYEEALKNGEIIQVSLNYGDTEEGLFVPTYMIKGDPDRGIEPMTPELKTVKDLERYWEIFKDPEDPTKGRIYGSIPGWTTDEILREKLQNYGLLDKYNYFSPGTDTALATSMVTAVERGKPWVGYYWGPTWVLAKLDMTLLEDEEFSEEKWDAGYLCEFPPQPVYIDVHKDLPARAPDVVEFLKNYKTSSALTGEGLLYMKDNDADAEEAAMWFLKEHQEIWTKWVPNEVAEKVKAAIN